MDKLNINVLKEPRGFIRILQVLFAIISWSTTATFSTTTLLQVDCPDGANFPIDYKISYPFDLTKVVVSAPFNCTDDTNLVDDIFPIDFSSTAMLYTLISALSLFYAIGCIVYYALFSIKYQNDPLVPMVDFCITFLFTILWTLIACTWLLNVTDLKHYTHPNYFKDFLNICSDPDSHCQPSSPGKWSSLTASIICGFTCVVLWLGSSWFVFKETTLHRKPEYVSAAGAAPAQNQNQTATYSIDENNNTTTMQQQQYQAPQGYYSQAGPSNM